MTVPADEPTLRIIVLRRGLELIRLAATPGGTAYAETYRPAVGTIVELPILQGEAIVRNGAGELCAQPENTPC